MRALQPSPIAAPCLVAVVAHPGCRFYPPRLSPSPSPIADAALLVATTAIPGGRGRRRWSLGDDRGIAPDTPFPPHREPPCQSPPPCRSLCAVPADRGWPPLPPR
ncbi:hypothetical protein ZWY2020_048781 [Hordeum vulgare]|nr:hypothetical protein ZWY2020_057372 [Hordeum vulgare]KAI4975174.1 hypothetical protein ZWY2020_048781 [Hordeum vulgare]